MTTYANHPSAGILRWYLSGDARGDLGVASNYGPFDRYMQLGRRIQGGDRDAEPDEKVTDTAARLRRVETAFRALPVAHQNALAAAYGPQKTTRFKDLDPERAVEGLPPRVVRAEPLAIVPVLLSGPAFAEAFGRVQTRLSALDWYRKLEELARRRPSDVRAQLLTRLFADACARLDAALKAFDDERRRQRANTPRAARRMLRSDEAARLLGVTAQAIRKACADGKRFPGAMRTPGARETVWNIPACCVEAELVRQGADVPEAILGARDEGEDCGCRAA